MIFENAFPCVFLKIKLSWMIFKIIIVLVLYVHESVFQVGGKKKKKKPDHTMLMVVLCSRASLSHKLPFLPQNCFPVSLALTLRSSDLRSKSPSTTGLIVWDLHLPPDAWPVGQALARGDHRQVEDYILTD